MLLQLLLVCFLLEIIYVICVTGISVKTGIHDDHYFFGSGSKSGSFKIKNLTVSIGFFIPFLGLARIYRIDNGKKENITMPWQFFRFSKWKRFLVTISGVLGLYVISNLTFIVLSYLESEPFISKTEINKHGLYPSETARKAGFKNGDKVIAVDGRDYNDFKELLNVKEGTVFSIVRNGKKFNLTISNEIANETQQNKLQLFLYLAVPFEIREVLPASPAEACGLIKGDKIKKVNGKAILKQFELTDEIRKDEDKIVNLEIERLAGNEIKIISATVKAGADNLLGFTGKEPINYTYKQNTFGQAFFEGIKNANSLVVNTFSSFITLIEASEVFTETGPIGIANESGSDYDWKRFWTLFAALAMVTCLYNILPVPGSVFWQTIPLLYEGIFRKEFPIIYYMRFRTISYTLIIILIVLVIGSDLSRILL
jgi:regulator of sigma E protease